MAASGIIEFTGENGQEIASAMMASLSERRKTQITIQVNPEVSPDLSLDQVYEDGQVGQDRWRVPLGYRLNLATGEVLSPDSVVQDYANLVGEENR